VAEWGNRGTEIILPLSSKHLVYTQIGSEWKGDTTVSIDQTLLIQRFIAERAHRWIFARGNPQRAVWFRPRRVDQTAFWAEAEAWEQWHEHQRAAERGPAQQLGTRATDLSA
jgi:hypothetical protein